jgi:hypothetical protein
MKNEPHEPPAPSTNFSCGSACLRLKIILKVICWNYIANASSVWVKEKQI